MKTGFHYGRLIACVLAVLSLTACWHDEDDDEGASAPPAPPANAGGLWDRASWDQNAAVWRRPAPGPSWNGSNWE